MQHFESQNFIVIRDNGFTAVANCSPYDNGKRGELEIRIYRDGHMAEADKICVSGGKLTTSARSSSLAMLHELLRAAFRKWRDLVITFDCPDERRARVYAAMLNRYGINYNQTGSFFELV